MSLLRNIKDIQDDVVLIINNLPEILSKTNEGLINLKIVVNLCFLSVFCRENIMLFGPPGTAKTLVAERVCKTCTSNKKQTYFYYLLNKFTTPEEIFGPISIK